MGSECMVQALKREQAFTTKNREQRTSNQFAAAEGLSGEPGWRSHRSSTLRRYGCRIKKGKNKSDFTTKRERSAVKDTKEKSLKMNNRKCACLGSSDRSLGTVSPWPPKKVSKIRRATLATKTGFTILALELDPIHECQADSTIQIQIENGKLCQKVLKIRRS